MEFTKEQKLLQDMSRKFVENELLPIADNIDKKCYIPKEIIKRIAELGFMGILVPEKYEGANLDITSFCIIIEEIAKVCPSLSLILICHNIVSYIILKYGNENQKELVKKLAKGEWLATFIYRNIIGKKENNKYFFYGKSEVIPSATLSDLFLVFAKFNGDYLPIILEKNKINIIKRDYILGMRASGIADVELNLTNNNILHGDNIFFSTINLVNLLVSACAVGLSLGAFNEAVKYSKQRKQFGKFICEFDLVKNMLSEMKTRIKLSRLLVYDTATTLDEFSCSLAKYYSTSSAVFVGIKAIQIFGGYGYTRDYPVERYFRDAKFVELWPFSSDYEKIKFSKKIFE